MPWPSANLLRHAAQVHPLDRPQQVAGGQHGADTTADHQDAEQGRIEVGGRVVGAEQRQHLAPEPGETR